MHRLRLFRLFHVLICLGLWSGAVQALTASEASAIAVGETDARLEALAKAVATADDRTAAFIQALADDAVKVSGGRVFIVRDGKGVDPLTGLGIAVPADAEDVVSNNRMRGELDNAMAALKLFSKDDKLRLQGVKALLKEPDEARLPLVEKALAASSSSCAKLKPQQRYCVNSSPLLPISGASPALMNCGEKGLKWNAGIVCIPQQHHGWLMFNRCWQAHKARSLLQLIM